MSGLSPFHPSFGHSLARVQRAEKCHLLLCGRTSSAPTQQAVTSTRGPVPNERRRRRPPHGRRTGTTGEWPPATTRFEPAPARRRSPDAGRLPRGRVRSPRMYQLGVPRTQTWNRASQANMSRSPPDARRTTLCPRGGWPPVRVTSTPAPPRTPSSNSPHLAGDLGFPDPLGRPAEARPGDFGGMETREKIGRQAQILDFGDRPLVIGSGRTPDIPSPQSTSSPPHVVHVQVGQTPRRSRMRDRCRRPPVAGPTARPAASPGTPLPPIPSVDRVWFRPPLRTTDHVQRPLEHVPGGCHDQNSARNSAAFLHGRVHHRPRARGCTRIRLGEGPSGGGSAPGLGVAPPCGEGLGGVQTGDMGNRSTDRQEDPANGMDETHAVDERMRFVMAVEKREEAFAAVCRRLGVSRKTGYKWLGRYDEAGVEGFIERSRAPLNHPHAIIEAVAERCLAVRAHPAWGPAKVRAWLVRCVPQSEWPAASTIGALFDQEG